MTDESAFLPLARGRAFRNGSGETASLFSLLGCNKEKMSACPMSLPIQASELRKCIKVLQIPQERDISPLWLLHIAINPQHSRKINRI